MEYQLSFRKFLLREKEAKFLLLLSIVFAYFAASKSDRPELEFILTLLLYFTVVILPFYFYSKWRRKQKYEKGMAMYPFGYEVNNKNFPNLFKLGKESEANLKAKLKEFADKNCRGKLKLAIETLDLELKNNKKS